jgi:hypothetical protein
MISGNWHPANLPDGPPLLQVIVDTEEEFDWNAPFDRNATSVASIEAQSLAQALYAPYDLRPTYMIDFPVADSPSAVNVLKGFQEAGRCQIGAHLHPWVNPPHEEMVNARNSYPGNLPLALEKAKLTVLTETIMSRFGRHPAMYKAGRYGVGHNSTAILRELGYQIDLSVVPYTDFRPQAGPDFSNCPDRPYWFANDMLEIPMSRGFSGFAAGMGRTLYGMVETSWGRRLRLGGVLSNARVLERATLTPEGVTYDELTRLARAMRQQGHRLFTLSYHSPSLAPGNTPYARTMHDVASFLDRIRDLLRFFFEELGAKPTTPEEVLAMAQLAR